MSVDNANDNVVGNADRPQQPDDHALGQAESAHRNGQEQHQKADRHEGQVIAEGNGQAEAQTQSVGLQNAQQLHEEGKSQHANQDSRSGAVFGKRPRERDDPVPEAASAPPRREQERQDSIEPQQRNRGGRRERTDGEDGTLEPVGEQRGGGEHAGRAEDDDGDHAEQPIDGDRRDGLVSARACGATTATHARRRRRRRPGESSRRRN